MGYRKRRSAALPTLTTRQVGSVAEQSACCFLQRQGLRLVQRNFSCRYGEIDLIMRDGKQFVFVEVRLRNNQRFGTAAETVAASKQRKLIATAYYYLATERCTDYLARFDVIAVEADRGVHWIKNAFEAD